MRCLPASMKHWAQYVPQRCCNLASPTSAISISPWTSFTSWNEHKMPRFAPWLSDVTKIPPRCHSNTGICWLPSSHCAAAGHAQMQPKIPMPQLLSNWFWQLYYEIFRAHVCTLDWLRIGDTHRRKCSLGGQCQPRCLASKLCTPWSNLSSHRPLHWWPLQIRLRCHKIEKDVASSSSILAIEQYDNVIAKPENVSVHCYCSDFCPAWTTSFPTPLPRSMKT